VVNSFFLSFGVEQITNLVFMIAANHHGKPFSLIHASIMIENRKNEENDAFQKEETHIKL